MQAMRPNRQNPCNTLRHPSSQRVVMAETAMEVAPAQSQAMAAPKAVAMAVVHAAKAGVKAVVEVGAVDAAALAQTARLARNASASTPRANPCWRMPTCKARTPVHRKRPVRSSARTGARAPSAATAQAAVASAAKVASVASRAQRAAQKALLQQQPTAVPRTATATAIAKAANRANPVKAAVGEAAAMAVAHDLTVKREMPVAKDASPNWALRTVKTQPLRRQQTSQHQWMTPALQARATRTARAARSAAATAMAVNAAPVVNAKSAPICASLHSPPPRKLARGTQRLLLIQRKHQHPAWPMSRNLPQHRLLPHQWWHHRPLQRPAHACPRSPPLHCQPMHC